MIDLDYSVTYLDYTVTYPYPAPAVFDAITDFPIYPWWQPHVGSGPREPSRPVRAPRSCGSKTSWAAIPTSPSPSLNTSRTG
jgi:hypothetical protein